MGSLAQYPDLESSSARAFQGRPRGQCPRIVVLTVAGLCRILTGFLPPRPYVWGAQDAPL